MEHLPGAYAIDWPALVTTAKQSRNTSHDSARSPPAHVLACLNSPSNDMSPQLVAASLLCASVNTWPDHDVANACAITWQLWCCTVL